MLPVKFHARRDRAWNSTTASSSSTSTSTSRRDARSTSARASSASSRTRWHGGSREDPAPARGPPTADMAETARRRSALPERRRRLRDLYELSDLDRDGYLARRQAID